ncbi:MAG: putative toxin-antitoxin system toxin component, PIN family [Desulfococcaceae bacterium]|jgi:putative PIN family toxin of toxin-antitoxin system|nr:putative toxin-antitoxin system toxin component, PIN family [Desulfococcaceae bacterium]
MRSRKRFVMDCNIFVSFLLLKNSKPGQAYVKAEQDGIVLMSDHLIAELSEVLNRPKFDRYVSRKARNDFLISLMYKGLWIQPEEKIMLCRDVKDNMILELAASGKADYIISGDKDLLVLKKFSETFILTPDEFLQTVPSLVA